MPAIAVHHTDTSDGAWDGPANEARLRSGESASYYGDAFAWRDPDGDETVKASYKFIHHEVSADGDPGAANLTGCSTGIGVLNGGRGGTTIPDSDRRGVYNHLAAHLRDADREPPELKASRAYQFRSFPLLEFRISPEGQQAHIEGYAAVFDQWTEIGDWWMAYREKVSPGAFKRTIQNHDIRALINHNPDLVLGRNKSGTLTLREDQQGLSVDILPPDTSWAQDLLTSMRRGDVNQMSIGFEVIRDQWIFTKEKDQLDECTLLEIKLWDVSVVTFPAYPQTEAYVRSAIQSLQRYLPADPGHRPHSAGDPPRQMRHSLEQLRRRLTLIRATFD